MTERTRVVVRAIRIPPARRTVAGPVLADPEAGYEDVYGSSDGAGASPLGVRAAYVAHLTPEQVREFKGATNCLTVEPDVELTADLVSVEPLGDVAATAGIPEPAVLAWMDADVAGLTGTGVRVAVFDGGISPAVRARMGNRVVASRNFSGVDPGTDGITTDHGCMVAPVCVPPGAEVLDAIISNDAGSSRTSAFAAAVHWAVQNGAKIVNYSYSGDGASTSVARDAVEHAQANGVLVFASAGNDGQYRLGSPSDLCRQLWAMHSSIAFNHTTGLRAKFSNYYDDGSGCAPGQAVLSLNKDGVPTRVSGTSFSSPLMAFAAALLLSASPVPTVAQVSAALKTTAKDTASPAREEGRGRWSVRLAHASLSGVQPPVKPLPVTPLPEPWWKTRLRSRVARAARQPALLPLLTALSPLLRRVLGR